MVVFQCLSFLAAIFAIYDENNELIFTTDGDVNDIVEGVLRVCYDYSGLIIIIFLITRKK